MEHPNPPVIFFSSSNTVVFVGMRTNKDVGTQTETVSSCWGRLWRPKISPLAKFCTGYLLGISLIISGLGLIIASKPLKNTELLNIGACILVPGAFLMMASLVATKCLNCCRIVPSRTQVRV